MYANTPEKAVFIINRTNDIWGARGSVVATSRKVTGSRLYKVNFQFP
jgi:hypothetical protein